jgi:hypothetical protein
MITEALGVRFRRLCGKHPEKFTENGENSGFFRDFCRLDPGSLRFFGNSRHVAGFCSDGDTVTAGLKTHQEPAGRRDHGYHETRPGISLGSANCLGEIAEGSVH